MTSKSLKTTTAILAALALLQPIPALTQSGNGAMTGQGLRLENAEPRSFEEICDEAMIVDARACERHLQDLLAAAEAEAQAAADTAAQAMAEAEAAAQNATEAEASAQSKAEAEAAKLARVAARAEEQADQAAKAVVRLAAEVEAAAQAAADLETRTEAEAQAQAEAEADAEARAQAEAEADSETQSDPEAEADEPEANEAPARAEAEQDEGAATQPDVETPGLPVDVAEDCLAEIVDPDGTIRCIDELTSGGIAAIAAETGAEAETQAEVTTETVTEKTHRSSGEEFGEWSRDDEPDQAASSDRDSGKPAVAQGDTGMSDLEKAGLFVLGAVVVGAILSNGQRVEANTGDRVIVLEDDGSYRVLKDDDALLRQPGAEVRTERFTDGSTRTTVTRDDGTQIITIRDSTGRALRRLRIEPDGREYLLIDDTRAVEPVIVQDLPEPTYDDFDYRAASDLESLRQALLAADRRDLGRSFSLRQVREYVEVRELAPEINIQALTFATNSAALQPSQAEQLQQMGQLMRELILDDPTELFLIEGHTDAIGDAGYNLLLSDRRAESVALALNEYFRVPTENMIVQGYGESYLKIPTQDAERLNRRVAVRRITPLLQ